MKETRIHEKTKVTQWSMGPKGEWTLNVETLAQSQRMGNSHDSVVIGWSLDNLDGSSWKSDFEGLKSHWC